MAHLAAMGQDRREILSEPDTPAFLKALFAQDIAQHTLYTEALTHGSTGKSRDYQRLEFLGDRVLGLVIAEWLYTHFAGEQEGRMSSRLNQLVSGAACADVARKLRIAPHIKLGKQARADGGADSSNILGDVMESLIGAYYLDRGFAAARDFIKKHWADKMVAVADAPQHPKSALQEWAAGNDRKTPEYTLVDRSGPHHDLQFTVSVAVRNIGEVRATASSKQAAEKLAAAKFLETYT